MTPIMTTPIGLSERTRRGRAINAVAEYFRAKLSVPNIYLEPRNLTTSRLDLLAVDRAGGGDLHGVEIKVPNLSVSSLPNLKAYLAPLKDWPTHYRYLVLPNNPAVAALLPKLQLFSKDGIGRTGVLLLTELDNSTPQVELAIQPERYRVFSLAMEKIDRFLTRSTPDIETRV